MARGVPVEPRGLTVADLACLVAGSAVALLLPPFLLQRKHAVSEWDGVPITAETPIWADAIDGVALVAARCALAVAVTVICRAMLYRRALAPLEWPVVIVASCVLALIAKPVIWELPEPAPTPVASIIQDVVSWGEWENVAFGGGIAIVTAAAAWCVRKRSSLIATMLAPIALYFVFWASLSMCEAVEVIETGSREISLSATVCELLRFVAAVPIAVLVGLLAGRTLIDFRQCSIRNVTTLQWISLALGSVVLIEWAFFWMFRWPFMSYESKPITQFPLRATSLSAVIALAAAVALVSATRMRRRGQLTDEAAVDGSLRLNPGVPV